MAFGSTFLATNSSSEYRMRKVYLTHHPDHDYRIIIKPIEPKKKEETGKETADAVTPPVKEEAGAAAEKSKEVAITYDKKVMLYNHKKDYLGQKKTIQLTYDKAMKIQVESVKKDADGKEDTELLQTYTLNELAEISNNTIAIKEGSTKPKVSLSFELNRSHILKLNKVSVDIIETSIEEVKPPPKKENKKDKKDDDTKDDKKDEEKKDDKKEDADKKDDLKEDEKKAEEPTKEGDAKTEEKKSDEPAPKKEYKTSKVPHTYPCSFKEKLHSVRLLDED